MSVNSTAARTRSTIGGGVSIPTNSRIAPRTAGCSSISGRRSLPPGKSRISARGMSEARYSRASRSRSLAMSSVGALTAGNVPRTSVCRQISSSSTATSGVAVCRPRRATGRRSDAGYRLGSRRSWLVPPGLVLGGPPHLDGRAHVAIEELVGLTPRIVRRHGRSRRRVPPEQRVHAIGRGGGEQDVGSAALQRPPSTGRSEPTASRIVRRSVTRVSRLGGRTSRLEAPVPRRSCRISLENEARPRNHSAYGRACQMASTLPSHSNCHAMSIGP